MVLLCLLIHSTYRKDETISNLKSVIDEKNDTIHYYLNENGRLVSEKKAAEVRANELRALYPQIYKSITNDLNIRMRDLKAYMESEFKVTGTGTSEVHNHYNNQSGVKEITSRDGYLDYSGVIIDSVTAKYSYTYTDTIKQTISAKRRWFFGNESLYGSAVLSNPNAKIIGGKSVLIKEYRDKRFGLGVGVFYDGTFRLGVGIHYNLLKF